jgi:excisionase family DNA binding protein
MRVQGSVPACPRAAHDAAVPGDLLEAVVRAVTGVLAGQFRGAPSPAAGDDGRPDLPPLLAPQQAADLLGVSRNTVDRMVGDGDLPSVPLREGARQRMVRIPKAFMLAMLADLNAGRSIPSLGDYAARWQDSVTGTAPAAALEPAGAAS